MLYIISVNISEDIFYCITSVSMQIYGSILWVYVYIYIIILYYYCIIIALYFYIIFNINNVLYNISVLFLCLFLL